jgi:hypothetical protein
MKTRSTERAGTWVDQAAFTDPTPVSFDSPALHL